MTIAKDQPQRLAALDPKQSFIIQAPAGSGKTELLTQRFLVLLAHTKKDPEEVVAITFTRKAAAEMRARIYHALLQAAHEPAPTTEHALITWKLAKEVLERDIQSHWYLLQNPNRLRIFTIDSLCSKIAKSAPLISEFGTLPQVVEDAQSLYSEAAQSLLNSLQGRGPWNDHLEKLLLHLDNNFLVAETLFVGMLAQRDQWLSYVVNHKTADSRLRLEKGMQNIIVETLSKAANAFTLPLKKELLELAKFASHILDDGQNNSPITNLLGQNTFPGTSLQDLKSWLGLQELLLTKQGQWRATVNKNTGFPASSSALNREEELLFKTKKEQMLRLLKTLSDNEYLRSCLENIALLPPAHYSTQQWEIIEALMALLPILVAFLFTIFRERNVVDFIAIAQGAINALGDEQNPSDVALNLDYRIQHLLVDEFQDTSRTQYRLIELLTSGWQPNDGRTLFLVGDPMQSIYRFREAEVGIFLKVKQSGIGDIKLNALTLEVNFRSEASIIGWLNENFKTIFPAQENSELGAISFSPSVAHSDKKQQSAIQIHPLYDATGSDQANLIVNLIRDLQSQNKEQTIAVLVRSRSHLEEIIPTMKKAQLNFQAIEIERLIYSPVVSDLFALTKALCHLGDRISWLAILRAPWCGLTLTDLYYIANFNPKNTLWANLKNYNKIESLSNNCAKRLEGIIPILEHAIQNKFRIDYREWISNTWQALGGPACLSEQFEIQNAHAYFNLLDALQEQGGLDIKMLENKLQSSYIHNTASDAKIHVLTIHKAKGLEYDVVIIPSLEKKPAIDGNQLLLWLERQNLHGEYDLILAPIKSLEEDYDPIYRYLRIQENLKAKYETTRLLYVAITRARKQLHLIGTVSLSETDRQYKAPSSASFLGILWPCLENQFQKPEEELKVQHEMEEQSKHYISRLTSDWQLPSYIMAKQSPSRNAIDTFKWSLQHVRQVGIVIHELMSRLCQLDSSQWQQSSVFNPALWKKNLMKQGVTQTHLTLSAELIQKAFQNVIQDQRARWILDSTHASAQSEYPITININNEIQHFIMDRTFIDENGTRWIIDYKTTELLDQQSEPFLLDAKKRYAAQLEMYSQYFKLTEKRPIKLGLYFPLFSGWIEWDLEN